MSEKEPKSIRGNYKVSFRLLTEDDIPKMELIQKAAYEKPWDCSVIENVLDQQPNMHGRVCEITKVSGHKDAAIKLLIGSCLFQKFTDQIYIADLVVAPEYQRKGFGAYMVNKLKDFTNEERHKLFTIVHEKNMDALNFFKKQEFLGTQVHFGVFEDGDAFEMVYDIRG